MKRTAIQVLASCQVWAGSILAVWAMGCTQPHMVVPADVNQGMAELPVEGRSTASGMFVNEDFKIASYQVDAVSRGAKHSSKFNLLGAATSSSEAGYSFTFKAGNKSVHGECTAGSTEKGFSMGGTAIGKTTSTLGCACGNEKDPAASVVMSEQTGGNGYGGTLKAHSRAFQLKAIYEREGSLSDGSPAGYRVDGNEVVGVVDVLGKGRI